MNFVFSEIYFNQPAPFIVLEMKKSFLARKIQSEGQTKFF